MLKSKVNQSVQFSSVAQSCLTLCDPMNHSTPGLPVHHQHPELTQTRGHSVGDAIQPSHPLSSPSPPAPKPSQHQGINLTKWHYKELFRIIKFYLYTSADDCTLDIILDLAYNFLWYRNLLNYKCSSGNTACISFSIQDGQVQMQEASPLPPQLS